MNPSNDDSNNGQNKYAKGYTPKCWNEPLPCDSHLSALHASDELSYGSVREQNAINFIPARSTQAHSGVSSSRFPWAIANEIGSDDLRDINAKIVAAQREVKRPAANLLLGSATVGSPIFYASRITFSSSGVQRVQKTFDPRLN